MGFITIKTYNTEYFISIRQIVYVEPYNNVTLEGATIKLFDGTTIDTETNYESIVAIIKETINNK